MQAYKQESNPEVLQVGSIELERLDCRPARWGQTNNPLVVIRPMEVLPPTLLPWVK
jgi:hypothetical protein